MDTEVFIGIKATKLHQAERATKKNAFFVFSVNNVFKDIYIGDTLVFWRDIKYLTTGLYKCHINFLHWEKNQTIFLPVTRTAQRLSI